MAVVNLQICDWQGVSYQETNIDDPTWEQISMAIQELNNENRNDLYLTTDTDTWLGIGGGVGQYLLTGENGDDIFPTLVDPRKKTEPRIYLTVGGQIGDFPANWIHDLVQTLEAAHDFYENDGYSVNLNWVNS